MVVRYSVVIPAALSLLLLTWSTSNAGSPGIRSVSVALTISVGNKLNPVRAGDIWLQSYSHNGGEQFHVGSIVDGRAKISFNDALSPALVHPGDAYHDNWVILFHIGSTLWYTTKTFNHETLFSGFTAVLESVGRLATSSAGGAKVLVLPAPEKRTITFTNLDGAPVVNERVELGLHISNDDHCAVEQGPLVGWYKTNERGRLVAMLPLEPLAVGIDYFEPDDPYWWRSLIVVGPQKSITLRRDFRYPPQTNWHLTVKDHDGAPVTHAVISTYYNAGCGGLGAGASTNALGEAVLHVAPRITGWVAVSVGDKTQELTTSQRATLEKTGKLTLIWSQTR